MTDALTNAYATFFIDLFFLFILSGAVTVTYARILFGRFPREEYRPPVRHAEPRGPVYPFPLDVNSQYGKTMQMDLRSAYPKDLPRDVR